MPTFVYRTGLAPFIHRHVKYYLKLDKRNVIIGQALGQCSP